MKTLVLLDRDGTLIYDNKCNLGSQSDWKKKVKILPGVVKGIKEIRKIEDVKIYMITNQPGVAVKEFKLLTVKKANDVCKYIMSKLKREGAGLNGYFVCTHASKEYAKSHLEYNFDKKKLDKCNCMKPKPGMAIKALKKSGFKKPKIYVVGDRASDVKTALNVKGVGILVPYKNEPKEKTRARKLKKVVKKSFLEAAKFIKNENR